MKQKINSINYLKEKGIAVPVIQSAATCPSDAGRQGGWVTCEVITFTVNGTHKDDLVSIPRQQNEMLNFGRNQMWENYLEKEVHLEGKEIPQCHHQVTRPILECTY